MKIIKDGNLQLDRLEKTIICEIDLKFVIIILHLQLLLKDKLMFVIVADAYGKRLLLNLYERKTKIT